ncbi:hypothetical protein PFISCL1PPCAC_6321, partial [Pristionchus fissidentatus]
VFLYETVGSILTTFHLQYTRRSNRYCNKFNMRDEFHECEGGTPFLKFSFIISYYCMFEYCSLHSDPSAEVVEDFIIVLELSVEWNVVLASNSVVYSGVEAFSRPPQEPFVLSLLNLVSVEIEASSVALIDKCYEYGMTLGTDEITVLSFLSFRTVFLQTASADRQIPAIL